ncbi:MAG TPA: hypothetical protein VMU01_12780 [Rhizomicrobium sp.]|nr:hypothetical protein [Rhizomicrobium sp.]
MTAAADSTRWRDKKARSLREAARAACKKAATEHLPIAAAVSADPLRWHAEALVKTGHVHGTAGGREAVISPGDARALAADLGSVSVESGDWRGLTVERRDFDAYLEWLRTVW